MLSLDRSVHDANSPVAKRIAALSIAAGEIVVLTPETGNRVLAFFRLWRKANKLLTYNLQLTRLPTRLRSACLCRHGRQANGQVGGQATYNLITVQDTAYLALLAYLLAKKSRLPFEVQVHGFERCTGIRAVVTKFVLQRATQIRVVSSRLRQLLTTNYKLPTTKLYTLSIYTQTHPTSILPSKERRKPDSPFTFLTVGRLVPVKNIEIQIEAFAQLEKEFPDTRLIIVGDGPLRGSLQFQVESLRLKDKILLEGRQEDVGKYYAEADAFLLTSDLEGWGVAVTEAAAYSLPIIITDVGLAGEFIKGDENGLVIPVGDTAALVSAMKRLATYASLRKRLGEAALRAFEALPAPKEQIQKQVAAWKSFI
jgi:glycosyltransferase involved in cell wall biosynthesis